VEQETYQGGPNDPAAQALAQTSWLQVVDPGSIPALLRPYGLDAGEAAVLTGRWRTQARKPCSMTSPRAAVRRFWAFLTAAAPA